ncbi:HAD-IA family hydrolase [Nocardia fusca]|uniref:HAD-IA family hydrolase n=1 Tax=Nocardia fusca TaxID=941183 RepID=UPI0037CA418E
MARCHPAGDPLYVAAVLFDLDGTLIDSLAATEKAWNRWAIEFDIDMPTLVHGVTAKHRVDQLIPPPSRERALHRIDELELEILDGIALTEGSTALLSRIPQQQWAIVTSCSPQLASARMRAATLAPPPTIITAADVTHSKPNPEGYLAAAAALGVDPADCLVIEDAPAGLHAGSAAGCWTIGVTQPNSHDDLDATYVVGSLGQIRATTEPRGIRINVGTRG